MMFVKKFDGGNFLILLLYVNDMLIIGLHQIKIGNLKKALNQTFSVKDLGSAKQILGMHIVRNRTGFHSPLNETGAETSLI